MPRLRLEQTVVELGQLGIVDMLGQCVESFAATGFDQSRHEQPIDRPVGLLLADQCVQLVAILTGLEAAGLSWRTGDRSTDIIISGAAASSSCYIGARWGSGIWVKTVKFSVFLNFF